MEEHSKINSCRQRSRRACERQQIQQYSNDTKYRISTRHLELMSEEIIGIKQDNVASLDTPCRKIASLKLEAKVTPKPTKQSKLLSSKSLSQLVPRNFFFIKNKQQAAGMPPNKSGSQDQKSCLLKTTRSLTNAAFQCDQIMDLNMKDDTTINSSMAIKSVSLIGLPRPSTSSSVQGIHGYQSSNNSTDCCSLTQPNISPIVGDNLMLTTQRSKVATSTPQETKTSIKSALRKRTSAKPKDKKNVNGDSKNTTTTTTATTSPNRYRPFKNTALVLRDVKNSIGLRIRARHQRQAFAKLDEEVSTPPSKLYSPFNIYTPESKIKAKQNQIETDNEQKVSNKLINLDESLSSRNWLLHDKDDSF